VADVSFGAFAGIRNTVPAERLESADLTAAVNVDIDNGGRAQRRPGTEMRLPGPAHSLWSQGEHCLFVRGDTLHRLHLDYAMSILATGLTPDLPMNYQEVNGRVYWSNGVETGVVAEEGSRSWGIPVPDLPDVSPIRGTLSAGQYQLALTYLRSDGQESGTGMAAQLTLAEAGGVRVLWDTPQDPTIIEVAVYITEPNGKVLYQAGIGDVGDRGADITSIRLSLPCDTQWLDAPPAGQCLAYHRGRILIAVGAHLFTTTALGYEYVDMRDYLAIDDTTIRFLAGVEHGIYVGTEKNVYFLAGDRLEDMTMKVAVEGAAVARSVVYADGFAATGNAALAGQQVVLFACAAGVCMGTVDGTIVNITGERYRFTSAPTGAAALRQSDALSMYMLFMPEANP
jgi:hypothetical protein